MATSKKTTKKTPAVPPATTTPTEKGRMALVPSVNGAAVIEAYQSNFMGKDADINAMIEGLRDTFRDVKDGDLSNLEAMLISQATALQAMFTSLARRAVAQEHLRQYETFMGLALKAQSQSRATISALVDLKFPRQATYVKQANIAHGPQQVNNGTAPTAAPAHAQEIQPEQNKLLEASHGQRGGRLDTRTAQAAGGVNPTVEALEQVHRTNKP